MLEENAEMTAQTEYTEQSEQPKRTTTKQRRASMEEYRDRYLYVPKIVDRQTIFISRDERDRIDRIVRQLGDRKLSVSGFVQNVLSHHLEMYSEDVEQWRKL
ncbi:MAG: DUF3408 domain-containing protein [Rikenellaceae bacterium]